MVNNNRIQHLSSENYENGIKWALEKPEEVKKTEGKTKKQLKDEKRKEENEWGKILINRNCTMWSSQLGELLVYTFLFINNCNPKKPKKKSGFQPDWETDKYVFEVKTSNWWTDGTAGEKVYGTWIKYQDIPKLYGKPLKIICIASQEWELEFGKTPYFGDKVTDKTKKLLEIAKEWEIEYVRFSDFIKSDNYK